MTLAVVDDRNPVAQLFGFLEIMRRQHDGDALVVQRAYIAPQLLCLKLDVDSGGGFVKHKDWRRMNHCLGDQKPPSSSPRTGSANKRLALSVRCMAASKASQSDACPSGTPYRPCLKLQRLGAA
jgi:hypothetical protein